jgi:hypothetical protein
VIYRDAEGNEICFGGGPGWRHRPRAPTRISRTTSAQRKTEEDVV